MIKYLIVIISGLVLSCSQTEKPIPSVNINNSKVYLNPEPDTIFTKEFHPDSLLSVITCPKCKFSKTETMPTEFCLIKYTCANCKADLHPKNGDCCVFCTYGTLKCPSKQ